MLHECNQDIRKKGSQIIFLKEKANARSVSSFYFAGFFIFTAIVPNKRHQIQKSFSTWWIQLSSNQFILSGQIRLFMDGRF